MKNKIGWWSVGILSLFMASPAFADKPRIYLVADLGYAKTYYGNNSSIQNFVSTQQPNLSSHLPLVFDLAGMRGLGTHWALGIGLDSTLDYYYQNSTGSLGTANAGDVTDIGFVATVRYSFGSSPLSGLYLRGDVGLGVLNTSSNVYSFSAQSPSATGLFLLGGAGFNLPISPHAALHAESDYMRNFISGGSIGALEPIVGIVVLL